MRGGGMGWRGGGLPRWISQSPARSVLALLDDQRTRKDAVTHKQIPTERITT